MEAYDVVIIGAGHNALVCAGYLLKAGYSVLTWFKSAEPRLNHHLAGLFGVSSKFEVTAVCLSQLV